MPISTKYFYHEHVKKVTAAVGYLFSGIKIQKKIDGKKTKQIEVPLVYSNKEKWWKIINSPASIQEENPSLYKAIVQKEVPLISYYLLNIEPDAARQVNTNVGLKAGGSILKQRSPILYNFEVRVTSTRNDDLWQIIEQVLPWFTPTFTFNINDVDYPKVNSAYKMTFQGVDKNDEYEGQYDENNRYLSRTLTFQVEGYLYGPTDDENSIIKNMNISFNNADEKAFVEHVDIIVDPEDATACDNYTINTNIRIESLEE